jgi:hypothetical protein
MSNHYSTNNNVKRNGTEFNIWLVNNRGEILIKNFCSQDQSIKLEDIVVVGDCVDSLLQQIGTLWKYNDSIVSFRQVYTFNSTESAQEISGYILEIGLNESQQNELAQELGGSFVHFIDIEDHIKHFKKNSDFLEAYVAIIEELDKVYGITPVDLA